MVKKRKNFVAVCYYSYFCNGKAEGLNGRVLARSNNNGNANAGVAYANANNASSNSNTNYGSRLANNKKGWALPMKQSLLRHIFTGWRIAESERPEPQQKRYENAGKLKD